jgi:hypothetical protein
MACHGSTLKDYAAKIGLDVRQLYELRRRLVRKGAFGSLPRGKARKSCTACSRRRSEPQLLAGFVSLAA